MTPTQQRVAALQERIFAEDYHSGLWLQIVKKRNLSVASIGAGEHNDRDLVLLCHWFWEALPDSPAIRRGPFFDLCDIAENIWDQDA